MQGWNNVGARVKPEQCLVKASLIDFSAVRLLYTWFINALVLADCRRSAGANIHSA